MSGESVESFRIDFDDSGLTQKAEAGAAATDRLAEGLDKVEKSTGKTEAGAKSAGSAVDKLAAWMRQAEQAVGGWAAAQMKAFEAGMKEGQAEEHAAQALQKRTAATHGAIGPEADLTKRIHEHAAAQRELEARAKAYGVSVGELSQIERAAAREQAAATAETKKGAHESREAIEKLQHVFTEATGTNLGFAQGLKGLPPELIAVGAAAAIGAIALGLLREKFADAERVAGQAEQQNQTLQKSLEHLEEKTGKLTRSQAGLLKVLQEQERLKNEEKLAEMAKSYDWLNVKAELFAWIASVIRDNLEFFDLAVETAIHYLAKFESAMTLGAMSAEKFETAIMAHVPSAAKAFGGAADHFAEMSKKAEQGMQNLQIAMQNFGASDAIDKKADQLEELHRKQKQFANEVKAAQNELAQLERKANDATLAGKLANYETDYHHFEDLCRKKLITEQQLQQARRLIDQQEKDATDEDAQKKATAAQQLEDRIQAIEGKSNTDSLAEKQAANLRTLEDWKKMLADKKIALEDYNRVERALLTQNYNLAHKEQLDAEKKADAMKVAMSKKAEDDILHYLQQSRNKGAQAVAKAVGIMRKAEEIYHAWKNMQEALTAVKTAQAAAQAAMAQATSSGVKIAAETPNAAVSSYSSMASIPFVGPILGFIAAAAAIAYGLQQQGEAKSAASGISAQAHGGLDRVPDDMTVFVKRDEMIVPPDPARVIRSFVEQTAGQGKGGGGDQHIYLNAPWYGGAEALREVRREGSRMQRRTSSARRS